MALNLFVSLQKHSLSASQLCSSCLPPHLADEGPRPLRDAAQIKAEPQRALLERTQSGCSCCTSFRLQCLLSWGGGHSLPFLCFIGNVLTEEKRRQTQLQEKQNRQQTKAELSWAPASVATC